MLELSHKENTNEFGDGIVLVHVSSVFQRVQKCQTHLTILF